MGTEGYLSGNSGGGSGGDVVGPASSTDNAVAKYDSTTGKLLQNSGAILTDDNEFQSGAGDIDSPTYSFSSETNTGWYLAAAGNLTSTINGSNSLTVKEFSIDALKLINAYAGISATTLTLTTTPLAETSGGTGTATFTTGDILYASAANTLSKLAVGSDTEVLTLASGVPSWAAPSGAISSSFSAYQGTTDSNVSGDGTYYTLGDTDIGTALTERIDTGSDFTTGASGGALYTAPAGGNLQVNYFILAQGMTTSHSFGLRIITSNESYTYGNFASGYISGNLPMSVSLFTDMDSADTCKFQVDSGGSTKVIDVFGDTTSPRTSVSGFLIPT